MAKCSCCGERFNVNEARREFDERFKGIAWYDGLDQKLCFDCALPYGCAIEEYKKKHPDEDLPIQS